MTCAEIKKSVSSYLDREMSSKKVQLFESHLRNCRACRNEVHRYSLLDSQLREICELEPRTGLSGRIMASITQKPPAFSFKPAFVYPVIFLLFFFLGLFSFPPQATVISRDSESGDLLSRLDSARAVILTDTRESLLNSISEIVK